MFSKALLLFSLSSSIYAYPSKWVTNEDGNATAYVVPRSKLAAECTSDSDGAYTCVSVSTDVTRIESFCQDNGHVQDFTYVFDRRDDACDDIHCRTDKPIELMTLDTRCNGYTLSMTIDANYLDSANKNAFYEITRSSFDGANKYGSLGQATQCGGDPTKFPGNADICWDSGPTNIQVSTFGGKYSGQFMETTLSVVREDTPNACDFVVAAALGAGSRLSPEAAGVLGEIQGICGD